MRQKSVNLPARKVICPATGKPCMLGATIYYKPDDIMQMPIDYEHLNEVTQEMAAEEYGAREEAERHG